MSRCYFLAECGVDKWLLNDAILLLPFQRPESWISSIYPQVRQRLVSVRILERPMDAGAIVGEVMNVIQAKNKAFVTSST